jgi:hypothetical protein
MGGVRMRSTLILSISLGLGTLLIVAMVIMGLILNGGQLRSSAWFGAIVGILGFGSNSIGYYLIWKRERRTRAQQEIQGRSLR